MKKNKIMVCFILIFVTLLLSGCTKKIIKGEIYKKDYIPERYNTIMIPMIQSDGEIFYTTYIPMIYHYDEEYIIYIKSLEQNQKGKYDTTIYYTTKEVFNSCEIGDIFEFDKNRDSIEEPILDKKESN